MDGVEAEDCNLGSNMTQAITFMTHGCGLWCIWKHNPSWKSSETLFQHSKRSFEISKNKNWGDTIVSPLGFCSMVMKWTCWAWRNSLPVNIMMGYVPGFLDCSILISRIVFYEGTRSRPSYKTKPLVFTRLGSYLLRKQLPTVLPSFYSVAAAHQPLGGIKTSGTQV
jgi:hypothetical protein